METKLLPFTSRIWMKNSVKNDLFQGKIQFTFKMCLVVSKQKRQKAWKLGKFNLELN